MDNNISIELSPHEKELRKKLLELRKEYSELIIKRDEMTQYEGPKLSALYLKYVGSLQYDELQLQLEIRTLDMKRAFLQMYINKDITPDLTTIDKKIEEYEKECNDALHESAEQLHAAKEYLNSPMISAEETAELKHLYKSIVKALHPDLHPDLTDDDRELFFTATEAYKMTDLDKLRSIYLMLDTKSYDYYQVRNMQVDLETQLIHLQEKVDAIKINIEKIEQTYPFNHREHVYDKKWIKEEQDNIKHNIKQLQEQKKHLESIVAVMEEYKSQNL